MVNSIIFMRSKIVNFSCIYFLFLLLGCGGNNQLLPVQNEFFHDSSTILIPPAKFEDITSNTTYYGEYAGFAKLSKNRGGRGIYEIEIKFEKIFYRQSDSTLNIIGITSYAEDESWSGQIIMGFLPIDNDKNYQSKIDIHYIYKIRQDGKIKATLKIIPGIQMIVTHQELYNTNGDCELILISPLKVFDVYKLLDIYQ